MIPTTRGWLLVLRLGLLLSAAGWGISFFFTVASWNQATAQLQVMGASPIEYQPLLAYWLRMASAVFGCIGVASAMACARPQRFESLIRLLGPFHAVVGCVLIVAAWQNQLTVRLHPTFVPDIMFCLLSGILIQLPMAKRGP